MHQPPPMLASSGQGDEIAGNLDVTPVSFAGGLALSFSIARHREGKTIAMMQCASYHCTRVSLVINRYDPCETDLLSRRDATEFCHIYIKLRLLYSYTPTLFINLFIHINNISI